MKKSILILSLIASSLFSFEGKSMTVYKSPYCGCCTKWIDSMESKGFNIDVIKTNNINVIKEKVGVLKENSSCHTAIVDGYFIEGHVPYSAIKRMLVEKPDIKGISVPGIPIGSLGMELGNMKEAYNVLSIDKEGRSSIYEVH